MLVNGQCTAHPKAVETFGRPIPGPPIGACAVPIVEDYLSHIKQGMTILEVGCGSWSPIKSHCDRIGAHYEGIDSQKTYYDKEVIATRIENLSELSYPDNHFDLVIGTQTMEHWAERGCSLKRGLFQCFRVCKSGGRVFLNVPIHFHGTKHFLLGDLDGIRKVFAPFSTRVVLESWGRPQDPLPPFYTYRHYWVLKNKAAYILDIQAIKDKPLPRPYSNLFSFSGRTARLLNYPFSFSLYLAARKLGLMPKD